MNGSSKDEGIIINKREYGEADRIVTIFTKEHGKLVSIIKGIRKSRKREIAATDIGVLSEIIFYERGEKLYISSIESKKIFLNMIFTHLKLYLIAGRTKLFCFSPNIVLLLKEWLNDLFEAVLHTHSKRVNAVRQFDRTASYFISQSSSLFLHGSC